MTEETVELPAEDAAARPRGPKVPRREKWVDLPPEYPGFRFRMWVNAPTRLWTALQAETNYPKGATDEEKKEIDATAEREKAEALGQIVLEHNGWIDFDDNPYPLASDAVAFWEAVPQELATTILVACQVEMSNLPNSLLPKRRR